MARSSSSRPKGQLSLIGDEILAGNTLDGSILAQLSLLPPHWKAALGSPELVQTLQNVSAWLDKELAQGATIYPAAPFRALQLLPPDGVRVVILGQDPYHGPNQAQGLAFSVPDTCPAPPSLRNILAQLQLEYPDMPAPASHDLSNWARQGVLLLNTSLTVEDGLPASHARKGWETVTDALLVHLADQTTHPIVYMLWGNHAQAKTDLIRRHAQGPHLILAANHPSPLSARRPPVPFMGCGHFRQANDWLAEQNAAAIDWLATGP
ncbi:uracil-DNA glycosylase [Alcaligenes sp. SDU_A2]|uniref:uracil-DNA glycosylase n=1 Tax=Alcaligenes sp. SDU_A2 TaxID=3136634 RepID=UPI0031205510